MLSGVISTVSLHVVHQGLLTICRQWRVEGATGFAYRLAISVPIRRSRGKKGGISEIVVCGR